MRPKVPLSERMELGKGKLLRTGLNALYQAIHPIHGLAWTNGNQKPYVGRVVEKRALLLCNGKLRLSTIQQAFGLSLIEMLHDSHWILLSADSEGFVPLTFTTTQEIIIRDGSL